MSTSPSAERPARYGPRRTVTLPVQENNLLAVPTSGTGTGPGTGPGTGTGGAGPGTGTGRATARDGLK